MPLVRHTLVCLLFLGTVSAHATYISFNFEGTVRPGIPDGFGDLLNPGDAVSGTALIELTPGGGPPIGDSVTGPIGVPSGIISLQSWNSVGGRDSSGRFEFYGSTTASAYGDTGAPLYLPVLRELTGLKVYTATNPLFATLEDYLALVTTDIQVNLLGETFHAGIGVGTFAPTYIPIDLTSAGFSRACSPSDQNCDQGTVPAPAPSTLLLIALGLLATRMRKLQRR